MKKTDKKILNYLERAKAIIIKEYSPVDTKIFDTLNVEIAKLIQDQEMHDEVIKLYEEKK